MIELATKWKKMVLSDLVSNNEQIIAFPKKY